MKEAIPFKKNGKIVISWAIRKAMSVYGIEAKPSVLKAYIVKEYGVGSVSSNPKSFRMMVGIVRKKERSDLKKVPISEMFWNLPVILQKMKTHIAPMYKKVKAAEIALGGEKVLRDIIAAYAIVAKIENELGGRANVDIIVNALG